MAHKCHATGCTTPIRPELLMCLPHWKKVPYLLKQQVWATYRPGQCDDMKPSRAYCEAAKAAVIAVAQREHPEPDTQLYDAFLWSLT